MHFYGSLSFRNFRMLHWLRNPEFKWRLKTCWLQNQTGVPWSFYFKVMLFKSVKVLACKCLKYLVNERSNITIWKQDSEHIFVMATHCAGESSCFWLTFKSSHDVGRQSVTINLIFCENSHLSRDTIQWMLCDFCGAWDYVVLSKFLYMLCWCNSPGCHLNSRLLQLNVLLIMKSCTAQVQHYFMGSSRSAQEVL